jgi:hypothetical protein
MVSRACLAPTSPRPKPGRVSGSITGRGHILYADAKELPGKPAFTKPLHRVFDGKTHRPKLWSGQLATVEHPSPENVLAFGDAVSDFGFAFNRLHGQYLHPPYFSSTSNCSLSHFSFVHRQHTLTICLTVATCRATNDSRSDTKTTRPGKIFTDRRSNRANSRGRKTRGKAEQKSKKTEHNRRRCRGRKRFLTIQC